MSSQVILFPFAEYWAFYGGFLLLVFILLALDLGVFHKQAHAVSIKEAGAWSAVWVTVALVFCYGLYRWCLYHFPLDPRLLAVPGFDAVAAARQVALEFLAGYVVEYSLSVDNIFVFVVVLNYFAVPLHLQHRVLFFGILGALVFRGIFIALGAVLMQFEWVVWVFGAFLVFTGAKLIFSHDEGPVEPHERSVIRFFKRHVPVTDALREDRFFSHEGGRWHATPLFVCLIFLEMTDILFAVDSVPAIFGLTREPFVVFTSNIFAILGLRNLYFLLRGAMDLFHLLRYGLGIVLVFVGLKMVWLNRAFGGHFPIAWSLGIILGVVAGSVALSLLFPAKKES